MAIKKRLKRVFIDLEYLTEHDLNKSLERLKKEILKGKESSEYIYKRNSWELYSGHKQWYPLKIHDFEEKKEGEQTIIIVKSNI